MLYNAQEIFSSIHNSLRNNVHNMFGGEGEKIFNYTVVALTSDVATNFVLWGFGFGPAYYGLKCIGFTFLNATFKYYIREKINDYFYDNYYLKHLIAGAVGGGSYYGFNYLFKAHMDITLLFNAGDLKNKILNGILNNSIWEFSSETLKTIREQEEWEKYTTAAYVIEALDCFLDEGDKITCLLKKQPIGAISRATGAYIRENLNSKVGSNNYQNEEDLNIKADTNEELESVNIIDNQHQDL
jgi:hypothetical protein